MKQTATTHQNRFTDGGDRLARLRHREVDGQIGETENAQQRNEALLRHKLFAVVVGGVVAEDRVHKLHHIEDVIHERDGALVPGGNFVGASFLVSEGG